MAPIRKGDGTALEIPGVSEVRSGDGRVFFEGDAIPDSAVDQYEIDEGSADTLTNATGTIDATITGASWTENADLVGGWGLSFDGSGSDRVDTDSVLDNPIDNNPSFAFAVTIDPNDLSSNQYLMRLENPEDHFYNLQIDDGNIVARGRPDGSTDIENGATLPDELVRAGVEFDGDNMEARVYVNGVDESEGLTGHTGINEVVGTRLGDDPNNDRPYDGLMDNPIWYDSLIEESGFEDDYQAQPFA